MTGLPARLLLAAALAPLATGCMVHHAVPPSGRPISVEHGRIVGAELVQRPSDAAQEGAIVGGFLGFLLSGRSLPEKIFGAWLGAAAGSAVAESNAVARQGWVYTVRYRDGRTQRVMTERPDLRQGECVAVESARYVNLRRVADALCEPPPAAAAPAEPSIQQQSQAEASSCEAAKDELTKAKTREETEVAIRKVRVFCDM
jgi:outer membrane lipoprotein SlyB